MLRPEGSPVAVMRQVEQLAAAQDVVGMLGKCLQQVELHAGQRNLVALGLGGWHSRADPDSPGPFRGYPNITGGYSQLRCLLSGSGPTLWRTSQSVCL